MLNTSTLRTRLVAMLAASVAVVCLLGVVTTDVGRVPRRPRVQVSVGEALVYEDGTHPIVPASFVYLVMGPYRPDEVWRRSGRQPLVSVFFLTWRTGAQSLKFIRAPDVKSEVSDLTVHHFPNCSWAAGRNRLYQLAVARELQQGWRYEYVIFWDDDVRLLLRQDVSKEGVLKDHHAAERHLQQQLLRDRPARASVENTDYFLYYGLRCVRSCAFDSAVDIFHRTAADCLLPYPTQFDSNNWWMSSETMNYRSATIWARYCNLYRNIVVDPVFNIHRPYPTNNLETYKNKSIVSFQSCLKQINFSATDSDVLESLRLYAAHRPDPAESAPPCTVQPLGVGYTDLLLVPMRSGLEECPSKCTTT